MPNWVKNVVSVSEDTMKKIKEKYFEDSRLDFNKIVPMPERFNISDGSENIKAVIYVLSFKKAAERRKIINKINEIKPNFFFEDVYKYFKKEASKELEEWNKNYISEGKRENLQTLEQFGNLCIENILEYGYLSWYEWSIDNWGTKWNANNCSYDNDTLVFFTAWSTPIPIFSEISKNFPNDEIRVEFADEDVCSDNVGKLIFLNGDLTYESTGSMEFANEVWDYVVASEQIQEPEM